MDIKLSWWCIHTKFETNPIKLSLCFENLILIIWKIFSIEFELVDLLNIFCVNRKMFTNNSSLEIKYTMWGLKVNSFHEYDVFVGMAMSSMKNLNLGNANPLFKQHHHEVNFAHSFPLSPSPPSPSPNKNKHKNKNLFSKRTSNRCYKGVLPTNSKQHPGFLVIVFFSKRAHWILT